ncbi:hypothetical protein N0V94_009378 [Neodidymelliopsis sp. IMI 364377]|nr:hypothetical protein N0V94_009378 [Neodidymelliopsis sp. IMI 364377]
MARIPAGLWQKYIAVQIYGANTDVGKTPSDNHLNYRLLQHLQDNAFAVHNESDDWGISIVETAGGVLSPGPSGTPQADIYRSLRLPTILVGDHKLGGIATTISAAESLIMRGYDINAVVIFDDNSKYQNFEYLRGYFEKLGIAAFSVPWIPSNLAGKKKSEEQVLMKRYYTSVCKHPEMHNVAANIVNRHNQRLKNMDSMASRTHKTIWHPFTQHKHVEKADDILVFDSAYGDYFQVLRTAKFETGDSSLTEAPKLYAAFDGSASWWTQGELFARVK